jgi:DNA-binding transcriptional regulator YiaG
MSSKDISILRRSLGLNQDKFGQLFGIHPMTVSKWERGILTPTPYQVAMMEAFKKAARKEEIKKQLKNILVAAGVVAAVYLLLKYSQD